MNLLCTYLKVTIYINFFLINDIFSYILFIFIHTIVNFIFYKIIYNVLLLYMLNKNTKIIIYYIFVYLIIYTYILY